MDWQALLLTLKLDLCVCGLLFAIGVPLAFWLAYCSWRAKFLVEAMIALPLVLPPTVLGFYLLLAMGPHSLLGRTYFWAWGHGLPFTFGGLVVASVIYSLPFMVQPISSAFAAVDPKLISASEVLGASRLRTFMRVILPLSGHWTAHRPGAYIRPHARRIRRGADGRRKHSRGNPDGLDFDLRQRSGPGLCVGGEDFTGVAGDLVRHSLRRLRTEPNQAASLAHQRLMGVRRRHRL